MIVFGHHIFAGSNGCEWGLVGLLDGVLNYGAWVLEVNINLLFEYRWEMFLKTASALEYRGSKCE